MKGAQRVLVIRCSFIDGVNPVEEVNYVLHRLGYCWFGKYGQPIGSFPAARPLPVAFAGGGISGSEGKLPIFAATEWATAATPPKIGYPGYYKRHLSRVGTWLRLESLNPNNIDIAELRVRSSSQPLKLALRESMRGHFWCSRQ